MKNYSLSTKIFFVVFLLISGAAFQSFMGIRSLHTNNETLNKIVNVDVKRNQAAAEVAEIQRRILIRMLELVIERDQNKMLGYKKEISEYQGDLLNATKAYESIASDKGKLLVKDYEEAAKSWFEHIDKVVEMAFDNKDEDVAGYREKYMKPVYAKLRDYIDEMNKMTEDDLSSAAKASQSNYEGARFYLIALSLILSLASLGIAYFIVRSVTRAIDNVIENLSVSSHQVTSASQQIASSSSTLSQASSEQAASLEETAASIEEMSSMIQKNSDNAKRTSDLSTVSQSKANEGKKVVQDMISAIDDISASNQTIRDQIEKSNNEISEIVRVINEIGEKTKVINDIVFQTKLLSFNASVEAARAGEHGKGFAVVAEEVGNLAAMSGNAAHEISSMLEGSVKKVELIVEDTKARVNALIEQGKTKVEAGTSIAQECGIVLDEIVKNVSDVSEMAKEISTACLEQSKGANEITKAIGQLDQVTQTNASSSEEAASAAEELSAQADSLKDSVGVLVNEIKGHGAKVVKKAVQKSHSSVSSRKEDAKVIPLRKEYKAQNSQKPRPAASFSDPNIPAEDDPRFKEI